MIAEESVPPFGVQLYVYGRVPPLAVTVALPEGLPKQFTFVDTALAVNNWSGCEITTDEEVVQALLSITDTVKDPADKLRASGPLPP
ncbi:MAG TPA: hypothetical protein VFM90_00310 [Cyclobacteriaceae bacterium]|nr:hypothetical protein [Cyclobacteriaceae bacterium]